MSNMDAWQFIINNWNCKEWTPIPQNVKDTLHLDSRLGFCGGMLVSKQGSQGMQEFIDRMNSKKVS
jgi:hypothetical protein